MSGNDQGRSVKEILEEAGKLEKDTVAVLYDGEIVDLLTPVTASADELSPLAASDPQGLEVVRHSAAHILADAVQQLFPGTKVTLGPTIEDGFFYDFDKPGEPFSDEDLKKIEKLMKKIASRNAPFVREVLTREDAISMFKEMGEDYKLEIIDGLPEGETISIYRHGVEGSRWVDLCRGPHVPSTRFIKAVKLTAVAGAYWRGNEMNKMLQRIYGTAFASKEALAEHLKNLEEAKKRDHRKLGKELDLFFMDSAATAMPFFLPKGAFVYNALCETVRRFYRKYEYDEVITPQAFDSKFFRTSGHLEKYTDNMYRLWTDDMFEDLLADKADMSGKEVRAAFQERSAGLKPMNCPGHCLMFGTRKRSYRELPWRVADFGRLHRYERGGVVHGLARVRSFCQDDAHIFCTLDQVPGEIEEFIRMLQEVYELFEFSDASVKLALRPEKRIGSDEGWDVAEEALARGLEQANIDFERLEGEGAFYGPKIEFHVRDALKRSWQLGTLQYDPNLPERFKLAYTGSDGQDHQPIMLHRAILGSVERFYGVYLEHCGGNFPTWLAPRQAIILTVSEKVDEYAKKAKKELAALGVRIDADISSAKLGAKIRNARLARYPYLCVVGEREAEEGTLSVRSRGEGELGSLAIGALADRIFEETPALVRGL
jgi:threonyl-tRNA synthetase